MRKKSKKNVLVTMRFSEGEMEAVQAYLQENPFFDSISSLGRVSTMDFIQTKRSIALQPQSNSEAGSRPSFLWDYNLTQAQVNEILSHAPFDEREWLIARILERLGPPEVFEYLTLDQISQSLGHLRMDKKVKKHWKEAVSLWAKPRQAS